MKIGNTYKLRDGFSMPVKKNDYWKVVLAGNSTIKVYWIPLG